MGFGCADCYPHECAEALDGEERKRKKPQRRHERLRKRLQFGLAGNTATSFRALQDLQVASHGRGSGRGRGPNALL